VKKEKKERGERKADGKKKMRKRENKRTGVQ